MRWKKASEHKPHHYWEGFVRREKSKGGFWAQWDASWGKFRNSNINMSGISPANHEWLDQDEQDEGWVPVEQFADFLDTERNKGLDGRGKESLWNDMKIWGKTTAFKLMLEKFKDRQPPATT